MMKAGRSFNFASSGLFAFRIWTIRPAVLPLQSLTAGSLLAYRNDLKGCLRPCQQLGQRSPFMQLDIDSVPCYVQGYSRTMSAHLARRRSGNVILVYIKGDVHDEERVHKKSQDCFSPVQAIARAVVLTSPGVFEAWFLRSRPLQRSVSLDQLLDRGTCV
jgi:hypothetical protein